MGRKFALISMLVGSGLVAGGCSLFRSPARVHHEPYDYHNQPVDYTDDGEPVFLDDDRPAHVPACKCDPCWDYQRLRQLHTYRHQRDDAHRYHPRRDEADSSDDDTDDWFDSGNDDGSSDTSESHSPTRSEMSIPSRDFDPPAASHDRPSRHAK
jgi:hypothetical protein